MPRTFQIVPNENHSAAFYELVNLRNCAYRLSSLDTKSKILLKATGRRLMKHVWQTEKEAAIHLLAQEW